ncbi:hypothetical protein [Salinibacter ruber]|uniref:hypothetical protein n=1 Tax=Salinibacter ruber TaxID=146919 RepID=UPI0021686844|nr:hypothetical protein [Salinibacter ruber]MCS3685810.1 hypothetical protein [Salinibacter ruber]
MPGGRLLREQPEDDHQKRGDIEVSEGTKYQAADAIIIRLIFRTEQLTGDYGTDDCAGKYNERDSESGIFTEHRGEDIGKEESGAAYLRSASYTGKQDIPISYETPAVQQDDPANTSQEVACARTDPSNTKRLPRMNRDGIGVVALKYLNSNHALVDFPQRNLSMMPHSKP